MHAIRDPRLYQIATLTFLIVYGSLAVGLGIRWQNAIAIGFAGLLTQCLAARLLHQRFDPLSPLITCLSLTLLLRTDTSVLAAAAAALAIGSKYMLRVDDRHFFNPANFAIAALLLLSDRAWVSAGQWGTATYFALAILCLGTIVVTKAVRADVTIAFLVAYSAMLVARAQWLGDPLAIPAHHLQSGALLIFAFFMISDPKTTPRSALARVFFAVIVAAGAMSVHFVFYRTNGLIWSLLCCAPLVPILDRLFPADEYKWPSRPVQFTIAKPILRSEV